MLKIKYQTERILDVLTEKIKKENVQKVIWLGYSPGFPVVYKALLDLHIREIRLLDNDKSKQGWDIFLENTDSKTKGEKAHKITVEPVGNIHRESSSLYICANTHYQDFVKQLGAYGVEERQILDLHGILLEWMNQEEEPVVSGFIS